MAAQPQKMTTNARMGSSMAISARKLAATLWELQEISLSSAAVPSKVTNGGCDLHPPDTPIGKCNASQLPFAPSPASSHVSMRALRRSSVKCRFGDGSKRKPAKRCQNAATTHMQALKLLENERPTDCPEDEEDTHEIEVDDGKTKNMPSFLNDKAVTGGNGGSTTSSELLKVLNRVWALEELHKSSMLVVNTLKSDLEEARLQVKELTIQQMSHYRDMESLNKQLTDEKVEWQEKEQEKTRQALQSLKEDLEDEKKSKRKLDLVHRKVSKELIEVKKSLMKALQDREREQKARELMEDVCDELAREVGEDKAKVEALKRESIKVREEVEEERKMLQVAEVWREERVQMKLAEARLEIEEKNTALDKLRMELDAFLRAKRASDSSQEGKGSTNVNGKGSTNVNSSPELSKTSAFTNGKQNSSALASLINEAYEVADEHRSPSDSSLDVEIKGTIPNIDLVNGKSNEYSFDSADDDDDETDVEDDQDLHSIELNKESNADKDSYMRDEKSTYLGRMNDVDYKRDTGSRGSVDLVNSVEKTLKQGARQGLETTNITQVNTVESNEDSRDRVKIWNFELDSLWRTEAKGEKVDKRVLGEDSEDGNVDNIKSNLQGEKTLSLNQDEPKGDTYICTSERDMNVLGLSESIGTSYEPSPSLSLEAVTNGVWSLQNLGSSRELKGVSGLVSSPMQQCASPTRNWGHSLSSPDPVRQQNASSAKASIVGGTKATKEKIVKGKVAEAKSDTRQPRFRICKAL